MQDASHVGRQALNGGQRLAAEATEAGAQRLDVGLHGMPDPQAERLPLMLLPGTLCDARVFGPLIQRLGDCEVTTPPMTGATGVRELAVRLLDTAPACFALLGFSLGGIIALEMAALAPDRIAGLALLNTNPRPVAPQDHAPRRAAGDAARRMGLCAYVDQVLWPNYVATASAGSLALRSLILDMAQGLGPDVFADQIEIALSRADSRGRMGRIAAPTLLLSGEADTICTLEMQREMAEALPAATVAIVPAAGHFAVLEAPDVVSAHVSAWLDEVQANELRSQHPSHVQARNRA